LRVAAAIAQGLGLASDRPLLAVSSLEALAGRAWREHAITHALTCVDARMGEVYWAEYRVEGGLAVCLGGERLGSPATVEVPSPRPFGAVGDGFLAYAEALAVVVAPAEQVLAALVPSARDLLPRARIDLVAGRGLAPSAAQPVYLRGAAAWKQR
jgi:tRNA threonylcarbamoyladenosine biosynthesis protein TsaB